jgi:type IV pilus assembly protein PilV
MYRNFKSMEQSGFTIIEVLISVLVISIGLLGMAGLQTTGIQQSHNSYLKTQASMLAYDMADRMRSNLQGVAAGNYNSVDNGTLDLIGTEPACATSDACTAAETANVDIYQWTSADTEGALAKALPSGHGMVENDGGVFTITVMWDEKRNGATGKGCDSTDATDMKCFQLEFIP